MQSLRGKKKLTEKIQPTPTHFSTANNLPASCNHQYSKTSTKTSQSMPRKCKIQFRFKCQDMLKFALSKLIPLKGLVVDPREGFIYGPKDQCQKLVKRAEEELSTYKFKKIQFKKEADLDEIEFQLNPIFEARVFRVGYIRKALNYLKQLNGLGSFCEKFEEALMKSKFILLRLRGQYEYECMEQIEQILKKSSLPPQKPKEYKPSSGFINNEGSDDQYEVVVDQQQNYYRSMREKSEMEVEETDEQQNRTFLSETCFVEQQQQYEQVLEGESSKPIRQSSYGSFYK